MAINLTIEENPEISLQVENVVEVTTSDYEKLTNKPKINGTTLVGNYNEIDPTVPSWAKTTNKPNYTADEVNAVNNDNEISMASIDAMISAIFD